MAKSLGENNLTELKITQIRNITIAFAQNLA